MITIIDYGMGNLRSVQKAFERINVPASITSDCKIIENAEKLVLPGVGHFAKGMENLSKNNIKEVLDYAVTQRHIPILGICLGMQLMTNFSEEGNINGLGYVNARTLRFNFGQKNLKIPHMGWNDIKIERNNRLFTALNSGSMFYFVHSYFITCPNNNEILATTNYGIDFVSAFGKDNLYGCQFHPEKSHNCGMQLLKNFSEL